MSDPLSDRLVKLFEEADALKRHAMSLTSRIVALEQETANLRACVYAAVPIRDHWVGQMNDDRVTLGTEFTRERAQVAVFDEALSQVTLPDEKR